MCYQFKIAILNMQTKKAKQMAQNFIVAQFDMVEEGRYVRVGTYQIDFLGKDVALNMCRRPFYGNRRLFVFEKSVPNEFYMCGDIEIPFIEQK